MSLLIICSNPTQQISNKSDTKEQETNLQLSVFSFLFGLVYGVNILEIDENQVKGKVVREQAQNQVKYYANASEATSLDKNCVICNK